MIISWQAEKEHAFSEQINLDQPNQLYVKKDFE